LTKRAGGKGANQAYALAKAGANVILDGNVGSDGVWVKEMLAKNGVDVSRVGVVDEEVSRESRTQSTRELISGHWKSIDTTCIGRGELHR
jgi:sugar/nucleoside kinase (ribokinase family)